jgi:hypothetical protein
VNSHLPDGFFVRDGFTDNPVCLVHGAKDLPWFRVREPVPLVQRARLSAMLQHRYRTPTQREDTKHFNNTCWKHRRTAMRRIRRRLRCLTSTLQGALSWP